MKIQTVLAAAFAASTLISVTNASELEDACVARMEADGRDPAGCTCLIEAIGDDESLIAELTELGAIDDPAERYSQASDAAKAAMDQCTRA